MLVSILAAIALGSATDVFVSATLDKSQPYAVTRIPALCRTEAGTLLAFAEGRRAISDQSSNTIILRRREKNGDWSAIQTVASDEPNALNNPCALVAGKTIWLMYQRYPHGLSERTTSTGFDHATACETYLTSSLNDGKSWTAPRNLTRIAKSESAQSSASGPGIGIRLERGAHAGRLLFPLNEGAKGSYDVFAVYSDDQGKTWLRGSLAPKVAGLQPNEVQIAELADGSVLLNARNQASAHVRLVSRSMDGGVSWSTIEPEPKLPDPVCMGSLFRLSFSPSLLLFSNAASSKSRSNGKIRVSRDEGVTWEDLAEIPDASFEYSSLCSLGGGKFAMLYESKEMAANGEGYRIRLREFEVR